MQPRLTLLIATLGAGCLPAANNAGELVPGSSGSEDGETTDQATTRADTASSTSSAGSGSDSDAGSTTGAGSEADSTTAAELDDPCLAFSPEACPLGECTLIPTYRQAMGSCDIEVPGPIYLCASTGEPLDDVPTTLYAEIDGEVRYVVHQQQCTMSSDATPVAFTECSGAAGEPELCQCLCGSQGCPYEAERLALEACELPSPCGELLINDTDMASDYDLCVLAALRDRTPGAYASFRIGFFADESHVFFFGGEEAQLVHRYDDDLCTSAVPAWDATRTCTLRPPAWFDACITDPSLHPDCLFGESWFEDCTEQPASCR